jgi:hypothetical protein
MYSLMLNDGVVREIDNLARMRNTNRSNLINQILAEYVSYVTPEKQISDIFDYIDGLLSDAVFSSPVWQGESIMCVKTSLDYKYRPTVKYSVEFNKYPKDTLGYLKVVFRTQSQALLDRLEYFFDAWTRMESFHLARYGLSPAYSIDAGKFTRSLLNTQKQLSSERTAQAITAFITMLDGIIKDYIGEKFEAFSQIEDRYIGYLKDPDTVII